MQFATLGLAQVSAENKGEDPATVKVLQLSKRGIRAVDPEVGRVCKALRRLDLSSNSVEDIQPLAGLFSDAAQLTWLSLAHNHVKSVGVLAPAKKLVVLNVSDNEIASLEPLGSLAGLQALIASDNRIAACDGIPGLTGLNTLVLSRNRLETLGTGVARLQNLQKLNLAENAFRAVPECVGSLALLTELRMHANKITTVPPFLANLRALKLLDLGKNCIARIEDLQVLRGLTQLKQLNLAGNPVAAHPDYVTTIISILPDLQVLDGVSRNLPKARRPRAPRAEAASEKPKEGTEDAAAAAEAPKKRTPPATESKGEAVAPKGGKPFHPRDKKQGAPVRRAREGTAGAAEAEAPKKRPPPATESKGGKPFHPRDKKQGAPQKPRGKPGARPGPKKPRMQ